MAGPIVVLVVEDDAFTRMSIVDALQHDGFTVHEARNSEHALAALEQDIGADCLLTDVDLGSGIDGLSLASKVHDSFPDMEIVIVSGTRRTVPADVPDARFFIKPYDAGAIAATVRELVRKRR